MQNSAQFHAISMEYTESIMCNRAHFSPHSSCLVRFLDMHCAHNMESLSLDNVLDCFVQWAVRSLSVFQQTEVLYVFFLSHARATTFAIVRCFCTGIHVTAPSYKRHLQWMRFYTFAQRNVIGVLITTELLFTMFIISCTKYESHKGNDLSIYRRVIDGELESKQV